MFYSVKSTNAPERTSVIPTLSSLLMVIPVNYLAKKLLRGEES